MSLNFHFAIKKQKERERIFAFFVLTRSNKITYERARWLPVAQFEVLFTFALGAPEWVLYSRIYREGGKGHPALPHRREAWVTRQKPPSVSITRQWVV